MIHKKLENLIESMKHVKLSSKEKSDIYNRTIFHVENSSSKFLNSPLARPTKSNFLNIWDIYIMERKFVPTMVFIGLLLITGGTSIAAGKSLPGDVLYPLKINVNEQVLAFTAFSPEAKAKFAAESTNERLKEAAILSSRGQLNASTNDIIQQQIVKNAGEIKNQVASLVSTNKLKSAQSVTINFESTLKAHALILEKFSTTTVGSLLIAVKGELATTTASRIDLDTEEFKADSNNIEKVQADLKNVQGDLSDAQKLFKSSSVSTTTSALVLQHFEEVGININESIKHINQAVYPEALTTLQHAEQILSDAVALINAEVHVDINKDAKQLVPSKPGQSITPETIPPSAGNVLGTSTPPSSSASTTATSTTTVQATSTALVV